VGADRPDTAAMNAVLDPDASAQPGDARIARCRGMVLDEPGPVPEYVARCVGGAAAWSDEFLRDPVLTTRSG